MNVEVTVKKSYKVSFLIKQYSPTEGGMDEDDYGKPVDTLEEAIVLLEAAITRENGEWHNWQIVVDVT